MVSLPAAGPTLVLHTSCTWPKSKLQPAMCHEFKSFGAHLMKTAIKTALHSTPLSHLTPSLPCTCQHMQKWWRAVTAKGVPSPHCPISTSSQSTRTPALECCIQQSGVKCQLCLKLLIQIKTSQEKGNSLEQEPFLLCICTVLTTVHTCFTAELTRFLKNTSSNYWYSS